MALKEISDEDIKTRFGFDNPWWRKGKNFRADFEGRRHFFEPLFDLVTTTSPRRAVLLLGPRRVGKTVLLHQVVEKLINQGVDAKRILYCSLDDPVYLGLPLERLLDCFLADRGHNRDTECFVLFDEIQYLTDWEIHLKVLVDTRRHAKFLVSGSAAAALKAQSVESGAGRFTDFLLPPMNFKEFVDFRFGRAVDLLEEVESGEKRVTLLNEKFFEYINFGGFPETAFGSISESDISRFVGGDIIERALARDLPSVYGISDYRELAQFFRVVAFNTGQEISPKELSTSSGLALATITKYFEYLEAAFLLRRVYKIDRSAQRFRRASKFKVYLTNPSLRAAMFGFSGPDDPGIGAIVETAFFAQWRRGPSADEPYYARWNSGEVDFVVLHAGTQKPRYAYEVKWSDRIERSRDVMKPLVSFAKKNQMKHAVLTSRTFAGQFTVDNITINVWPTSLFCYLLATTQTDPQAHEEIEKLLGT